jgi:plasmid maintenance system killer protein
LEILFKSKKLEKILGSRKDIVREWGEQNGRIIMKRLTELIAAENLSVISKIPGARPHPLSGSFKGMYAVDLKQPYRLIIQPFNNPLPLKKDGGLDLEKVTIIKIMEVGDYH